VAGGLEQPPRVPDLSAWEASLELAFDANEFGTRLAHRAHRGPLYVQRPFRPEGPEVCHVYVLHPPGGLVGGDALAVDVRAEAGASALVTTPAAGKAYRTLGPPVRQRSTLHVGPGASLEWLPSETIVYDGAQATFETRVQLQPGGRFIGAETLCLGLPARDELFERGACRQIFEIWRDGRPLFLERSRFEGGGATLNRRWGLGGASVLGLLTAVPAPPPAVVDELRACAAAVPTGEAAAVTVLDRDEDATLVCRTLGTSAERTRAFLQEAWRLLRPALLGRPAIPPRIWAT
jgi:urease accessory protein